MHDETQGGVTTGEAQCTPWMGSKYMLWAADTYCEHTYIQNVMSGRSENGWTLERIIECGTTDNREYVTLIWRKHA